MRVEILRASALALMKNRRFARDHEQLGAIAETLIIIAAGATLASRWP